MPTPEFGSIGDNPTLSEVVDYVHKLQKELNYLLQNIDDLNINRLTAKSIKAGTLDANLVTIRSDLAGSSYLQIDGLGIRANNGSINTFEIDSTGQAYFRGNVTSDAVITGATIRTAISGARTVLDTSGLAAYDSSGVRRIGFGGAAYNYYDLKFYDGSGSQAGFISGNGSQLNIGTPNGPIVIGAGNAANSVYFDSAVDFQGFPIYNANITAKFG